MDAPDRSFERISQGGVPVGTGNPRRRETVPVLPVTQPSPRTGSIPRPLREATPVGSARSCTSAPAGVTSRRLVSSLLTTKRLPFAPASTSPKFTVKLADAEVVGKLPSMLPVDG